ncbi:exonuclease domain-containing protein, partial [Salmonella enterica subsp. enterica serovar Lubbock]|nr:exonuclease domain-containing protein [Salmonella enterica subsp. enterica serovar Lubbock]
DLEMTGLDPERDRIIEIATLVTDASLNILAEGPTIAVHQSDAVTANRRLTRRHPRFQKFNRRQFSVSFAHRTCLNAIYQAAA